MIRYCTHRLALRVLATASAHQFSDYSFCRVAEQHALKTGQCGLAASPWFYSRVATFSESLRGTKVVRKYYRY